MKRISLFLCAAIALPAGANAQMADAEIARAVAAAPARLQADATVITFADDGSIEVLRQGSNGVMCWDESSADRFSAHCTSEENRARVEQNHTFNNSGGTSDEIQAMFDAAERDGTQAVSGFGTIYDHLTGADQASARSHMSIVVPFATRESLGIPDSRKSDGVWIMDAGTSTAHLMVPGR